jgi:hypothetical protein
VDTPYSAALGRDPDLDRVSVCEQQLRHRAVTVGGSFEAKVTALCGAMRSHVSQTPNATAPWIDSRETLRGC